MQSVPVSYLRAARRSRKHQSESITTDGWLLTFSDLATLLLTFFIVLVAISVVDSKRMDKVLSTVNQVLKIDAGIHDPSVANKDAVHSGVPIFDERSGVAVMYNNSITVVSINSAVLFVPGSSALTREGRKALDRLLPYLHGLEYPMLIAGHAGDALDEKIGYRLPAAGTLSDAAWEISLERAGAVYRYYLERGVEPEMLAMKGFGSQHPAFGKNTPEDRKKNRRVDLVLDKRNRNMDWMLDYLQAPESEIDIDGGYYYKNFKFDLSYPSDRVDGKSISGQSGRQRGPDK